MSLYRSVWGELEAVNVGAVAKTPENDWTGLPDWLRIDCQIGNITFDAHGANIKTRAGIQQAAREDFILRFPDGGLAACNPATFELFYKEAPSAPAPGFVGVPFTCGSRVEQGRATPDVHQDRWLQRPNGDRTCTYCGSLHEEDFFDIVEAYADGKDGYKFDPSTKGYKKYANRPGVANAGQGGIKFYGWHADLTPGPDLDRRNAIYARAMARYRGEFVRGEEIVANG